MKYDVFVSCRRGTSERSVHEIVKQLRRKGLSVFYKPVSVAPGEYTKARRQAIASSSDVVIALSPDCLTFCMNQNDPLRCEIEEALKNDKNIVCVKTGGFEFPSVLSNEMSVLRYKKHIVPEAMDSESVLTELSSSLTAASNPDRIRRRQLVLVLLICAAVFGLFLWIGAAVTGSKNAARSGPSSAERSAPPAPADSQRQISSPADSQRQMPPPPPGLDPSKPVVNLSELWNGVFTAAGAGDKESALAKLNEFKTHMEQLAKNTLPAFPVIEQYVAQIPVTQKPMQTASAVASASLDGKPVYLAGGAVIMEIVEKTAYSSQYQPGDIIYAVNGTVILSNRDLHEARIEKQENTVSVLRWNGKSFTAVDTKVNGKDSLGVALRIFSLQQ